jgi:hypothetical protein
MIKGCSFRLSILAIQITRSLDYQINLILRSPELLTKALRQLCFLAKNVQPE